MISNGPIGIAGAGSIGCFVGGMLAASGRRVALLARPRVIEEIRRNGLRLTGFEGTEQQVAPSALTLSEDPSIFNDASVVLVTVKSADTPRLRISLQGMRQPTPSSSVCRTASVTSRCCANDCRGGACWPGWCRSM